MKLWHIFTEWLDGEPCISVDIPDSISALDVNPASGLPMVDGTWLDIEGNPYGTDSHCDMDCDTGGGFDWDNQSIFD